MRKYGHIRDSREVCAIFLAKCRAHQRAEFNTAEIACVEGDEYFAEPQVVRLDRLHSSFEMWKWREWGRGMRDGEEVLCRRVGLPDIKSALATTTTTLATQHPKSGRGPETLSSAKPGRLYIGMRRKHPEKQCLSLCQLGGGLEKMTYEPRQSMGNRASEPSVLPR